MPASLKIGFTSFDRLKGVLVVFCAEGLKFGPATEKALAPIDAHLRRAAAADRFTGKSGSSLEIIAPADLDLPRLIVLGTGKERDLEDRDFVKLGGAAMGRVPAAAGQATILAEFATGAAEAAADRRASRSARGCAPTGLIATRPSPRRARSGPRRSR